MIRCRVVWPETTADFFALYSQAIRQRDPIRVWVRLASGERAGEVRLMNLRLIKLNAESSSMTVLISEVGNLKHHTVKFEGEVIIIEVEE